MYKMVLDIYHIFKYLLSPGMRRAAPGLRVLHPDGWSAGLGLAGNDPIK